MRVRIGEIVDIDNEVNPRELAPFERIKAGFRVSLRESTQILKFMEMINRSKFEARRKLIEKVRESLLYEANHYLVQLSKTHDKGKTIVEIGIYVNRQYKSILDDILDSKDFNSFEIDVVQEDPDVLASKPDMPIYIKIRKKTL